MERKEILSVVLVGLLLLTMAIQTVQLIGLSNAQVITAAGTPSIVKSSSVASGSNGAPKASLSNLPAMVGGC